VVTPAAWVADTIPERDYHLGPLVPRDGSLFGRMSMSTPDLSPLFSSLSSDPEMRELVEMFVGNLQGRIQAIERAVAGNDAAELARIAHQLRGAGGGYGFEAISESAASLEQSAKAAASVGEVATELMDLINLCRRATAQPRPAS
jgi:HPt (histidine-containing phosphotransfer) domain-containing protein